MAKTAIDAPRRDAFLLKPEDLVIITDKKHLLYDDRAEYPLDEAMVLNIMAKGVKQAITVRKNGDNSVEVVDGRQRVLHAIEANKRLRKEGLVEVRVPAMLEKGEDADLLGVMILTNNLRRDDGIVSKARKAKRLLDFGKSEAEVAVTCGVSVHQLKVWLRLLDLDKRVLAKVESGAISATAAVKLAGLSREEQVKALDDLGDGASGREVVAKVKRSKGDASATALPTKKQQRLLLERLEEADDVITAGALLRWICDGEKNAEIERLLALEDGDAKKDAGEEAQAANG